MRKQLDNQNNDNFLVSKRLIVFSDLHYAPVRPVNNGSNLGRKLTDLSLPVLEKMIDVINKSKPDASIFCGDYVEDFNDHDEDLKNLEFIWNKMKKIEVPFYGCVGNHDLRTMSHRNEVERILGYNHSTYSVDVNGVHLVVLGTEVNNSIGTAEGGIFKTQFMSKEDLVWLKEDLNKTDKPALVFCHFGIAEDDMKGNYWFSELPETALLGNRKELKEILKNSGKVLAVFSGHQHWTKSLVEDNISYYVVGSLVEDVKDNGVPDAVYFEVEMKENNVIVLEKHIKI